MKKTALITGGAKGIGLEFSRQLARKGFDLIIVGQDRQALFEKESELEQNYGVNVLAVSMDLSREGAAEELFEMTKEIKVDILINNAGFGLVGKFEESDWETEKRMIGLQITTLTRLTNLFMQGMVKRDEGKILNMSSVAGFYPGPYMSVYYATKAYILSFSEALAEELKGSGVTVTVLCPGIVATNFQKNAHSKAKVSSNFSLMGTAEEVAEYGIKAMERGKVLAIPGTIPKIMVALERIMPRKLATHLIGLMQRKNQAN